MDTELSNSLEAIANLLYLIRQSLHDPIAAALYLSMAEDRIKLIGLPRSLAIVV